MTSKPLLANQVVADADCFDEDLVKVAAEEIEEKWREEGINYCLDCLTEAANVAVRSYGEDSTRAACWSHAIDEAAEEVIKEPTLTTEQTEDGQDHLLSRNGIEAGTKEAEKFLEDNGYIVVSPSEQGVESLT
jgi:hypothetical protein